MSKIVPLEGFGGGSSSPLNFKIVAYATEEELTAAQPKENTIGVVTANTITAWIFSATEPAEPMEGMVWFFMGTSSPAEFNALKNNGIQIYPIFAKQYISGVWVSKDAMTYQNGEWLNWTLYLYNTGILNEITGGMVQKGVDLYDGIRNETTNHCAGSCGVTMDESSIKIASSGATCAIAYFNNKINLAPYKTLVFSGSISENNGHTQIGIWSEFNVAGANHNRVAVLEGPLSDGTYNIDISELSGEYYIGFLVSGFTNYNIITVKKVYLI